MNIARSMESFGAASSVSRARCLVRQPAQASATGPQVQSITRTTTVFCPTTIKSRAALPQTTTAAPLKDQALTRRVLELFKRYGGVTNRFSVLSTNHLNQIHAAFSPEDLMGVELILQGKEAPTAKAFTGRARARKEKLKAANKDDAIALPEGYPTTIACVSGFL